MQKHTLQQCNSKEKKEPVGEKTFCNLIWKFLKIFQQNAKNIKDREPLKLEYNSKPYPYPGEHNHSSRITNQTLKQTMTLNKLSIPNPSKNSIWHISLRNAPSTAQKGLKDQKRQHHHPAWSDRSGV